MIKKSSILSFLIRTYLLFVLNNIEINNNIFNLHTKKTIYTTYLIS